jgi:hypothetical protein
MRHTYVVGLVVAGSLGCASGGSTTVATAWRDPGIAVLGFHRALVAFVTTDQSVKHGVEDRMAERIPGSFPAYRSLPDLSLSDPTRARDQLRNNLFDGVIVMRVVSVENHQTYVAGSNWYASYPSFYGFWGSSWAMARDPGYVIADKVVSVETAIYSVADDKLVWAGRTNTENPPSTGKLVDRTVDAVAHELREQKLIP